MIWVTLLLGLILRLVAINQSFWLDEATTANTVQQFSFPQIITRFSPGDFHPPAYYLLVKAWVFPFGVSELSLRAFSVVSGLATVYVVYRLGKRMLNKNRGGVAAILLATAPLHIFYSQEARMYSLETLLTSLSFYFFATDAWILFSLSLALLGATDYLPLLIIPVFWIYGLLVKKSLAWFTRLAASHLPLVIFYVWWSPYLAQQIVGGLSVSPAWAKALGQANIKNLLLVPIKFMLGRISFANQLIYALIVGAVGLVFGYLLLRGLKEMIAERRNLWLGLWLIVPVALAFVLGLKLSVFSYFRLIFILPAFYLLVAWGLTAIKKKYFPLIFLAVVTVNMAFSLTYLLTTKFQREDWRGFAGFVQSQSKDQKYAVVFPTRSQQEAYRYYAPTPPVAGGEIDRSYATIWLTRYVQDISDPDDKTRLRIEDLGLKKTAEYDFNGVIVWKYENRN